MVAQLLILAVLPSLLVAAAVWDIASFTIPNILNLLLLAAFPVFAIAAGLAPSVMGMHVMAGFAGLAVGFALFASGLIGGGDAKLFAAVSLWFGFNDLLEYAVAAALCGGVLAIALLTLRRFPLPQSLLSSGWVLRLHNERSGIPYGVALSAGAFFVLPHTEIFRIAAGV